MAIYFLLSEPTREAERVWGEVTGGLLHYPPDWRIQGHPGGTGGQDQGPRVWETGAEHPAVLWGPRQGQEVRAGHWGLQGAEQTALGHYLCHGREADQAHEEEQGLPGGNYRAEENYSR